MRAISGETAKAAAAEEPPQDSTAIPAWISENRELRSAVQRNPALIGLLEDNPLLKLYGDGKELWAEEHADDYVRRLRNG